MWCVAQHGGVLILVKLQASPFVQFKKREKHPWRNVNYSKVAGLKPATLLKLTLLHGCFLRFLYCTNGTKSRNAPHLANLSKLINFYFF